MKLNTFIGFTVLALTCTNLFAAEIYNGKIIEQKEWATGKTKFSFNQFDNSLETFKVLNQAKNNLTTGPDTVSLSARGINVTGAMNTALSLANTVSIVVRNNAATTQQYNLMVMSCTDTTPNATYQTDPKTSECAIHNEVISLAPNGSAGFGFTPVLQHSFSQPGDYRSYVRVQLTSQAPNSNSYAASGTSFITIS